MKYATLLYFHWQGISILGKPCAGIIAAHSQHEAHTQLQKQSIITRRIYRVINPITLFRLKKSKQELLAYFARQLALLIKAGISLLSALDLMIQNNLSPRMNYLLQSVKHQIASGSSFSSALKTYPHEFPELFCTLIALGEKSGTLEEILVRIAKDYAQLESLYKHVKKALFYPSVLSIIAFIIGLGFIYFIIPQFESLYASFATPLPTFTLYIMTSVRMIKKIGPSILWTGISMSIGVYYFYKHDKRLKTVLYTLLSYLPMLNTIIYKITLARFMRTLTITYSSGLPLMHALKIILETSLERSFIKAMSTTNTYIAMGLPLHKAMEHAQYFPNPLIQMLAIGEESGTLEYMLDNAAELYEHQVSHTMEKIQVLLEPFIISIIGIGIGSLVIAMYLPIMQLGGVIS